MRVSILIQHALGLVSIKRHFGCPRLDHADKLASELVFLPVEARQVVVAVASTQVEPVVVGRDGVLAPSRLEGTKYADLDRVGIRGGSFSHLVCDYNIKNTHIHPI